MVSHVDAGTCQQALQRARWTPSEAQVGTADAQAEMGLSLDKMRLSLVQVGLSLVQVGLSVRAYDRPRLSPVTGPG